MADNKWTDVSAWAAETRKATAPAPDAAAGQQTANTPEPPPPPKAVTTNGEKRPDEEEKEEEDGDEEEEEIADQLKSLHLASSNKLKYVSISLLVNTISKQLALYLQQ